jgi:tyrosyl-tRNA synthetase
MRGRRRVRLFLPFGKGVTGGRQSSIGPMTSSAGDAARHLTRNAVEALPEGELERQLALGRPLRIKLGVDPTTPDIHLGHTVVLRKLREFQELGHTIVLIIGDYTARVGDPSGRSTTRPQADPAEIDANAATYEEQALKVLDRGKTEVRRNGEWLDMPMEQLFRLARTSTVAQLLERDDFAKRYAAGEPISVLELLYPLLQGYDSVAIQADVELGATDQKFNVLLGRDVQQAYGMEPQSILTMPILPGIDGVRKMSKSLGNYVGVDEPPDEVFGKLMRVPDDTMPIYYELLLDGPPDPSLSPPPLRGGGSGRRGALRSAPRAPRGARRGGRALLRRRQRGGASAGAAGGGLRDLAVGGAAPPRPGRGQGRRRRSAR